VKFEDSFVVPVPPAEAWETMTDIGRVAPCLPGAELLEIRDDEFHGLVRLKLGPITVNYAGTARFESVDPDSRRMVIAAQGRDKHGQGTVKANVELVLSDADQGGTMVALIQDIAITGRAAQFGRGVLGDVTKQMMGRFADSLTTMLTADDDAPDPAQSGGATEPAVAPPAAASEAIDMVAIARGLAAENRVAVGAFLAGLVTLLALLRLRRG
jgi:carbon monoxide dehydrogenase subunit G